MVEERRQHQRLVPNAPLFISLDDCKSGLLLDLCAGGLAVASLVPRNLDDVVSLAFDLPEGVGHIEAKATIAWTRDSGHLTGVRFVDLDDASQQQLSEWISTGTNLRLAPISEDVEPVLMTRSTYAQVDPISEEMQDKGATDSGDSLFSAPILSDPESGSAKSESVTSGGRERTGKVPIYNRALCGRGGFVVGFGFLGLSDGNYRGEPADASGGGGSQGDGGFFQTGDGVRGGGAGANARAHARKDPGANTNGDSNRTLDTRASTRGAFDGFRYRPASGAMKLEDNAAAMAQDLRKRKFPALVFRHGNDKLYRVAVGPYSDTDSTAKAKEQLEKQGFKPLLQRWAGE